VTIAKYWNIGNGDGLHQQSAIHVSSLADPLLHTRRVRESNLLFALIAELAVKVGALVLF